MGINKSELMALKWLKNQGYKDQDIIKNSNKSPDFICSDGARYEVKYLYRNAVIFYSTQLKSLKETDIILIFNNAGFVYKFLWKDRDDIHFKIKIVNISDTLVKVQLDKDIVSALIKLKGVGDTYSDVVRRLLRDAKNEGK